MVIGAAAIHATVMGTTAIRAPVIGAAAIRVTSFPGRPS